MQSYKSDPIFQKTRHQSSYQAVQKSIAAVLSQAALHCWRPIKRAKDKSENLDGTKQNTNNDNQTIFPTTTKHTSAKDKCTNQRGTLKATQLATGLPSSKTP